MTGKFIVFEGIDGSGKTTQMGLAADYLYRVSKRNNILLTREPTYGPYGMVLREGLTRGLLTDPEQTAEIFLKDRQWHLDKHINPNVNAGNHVLCDRYKLSTIAYQAAQGADMDALIQQHEGMRSADLTILFDLDPEIGLGRIKGPVEHFEHLDMQQRVRENYFVAAKLLGEPYVVVDAKQLPQKVAECVHAALARLFGYQEKS